MWLPRRLKKYKLSYSVTRFHVDRFCWASAGVLTGRVLDVGGIKGYKAGQFNVERVAGIQDVEYLNIDPATDPDYLCSAEHIPAGNAAYDGVILSEVLEHLEDPDIVLREIYRVLKPGAYLVMTSPFNFRVHSEPTDYQRWTRFKLEKVLQRVGFEVVKITELGGVFSVLVDITKQLIGEIKPRWLRRTLGIPVGIVQAFAVDWLELRFPRTSPIYKWTPNYGVIARKPCIP